MTKWLEKDNGRVYRQFVIFVTLKQEQKKVCTLLITLRPYKL